MSQIPTNNVLATTPTQTRISTKYKMNFFSGTAFVVTVKVKLPNLNLGAPVDPMELFSSLDAAIKLIDDTFSTLHPMRTLVMSHMYEAAFKPDAVSLTELINLVKGMTSKLHIQPAGGGILQTRAIEELPIACGIAHGQIAFDDRLMMGDALIESAAFLDEAVRRNALLAVDTQILPDIYRKYDIVEVKGRKVALLKLEK